MEDAKEAVSISAYANDTGDAFGAADFVVETLPDLTVDGVSKLAA